METFLFQADGPAAGCRLDQYLTALLEDTTRSAIQRLCGEGWVQVNGRPAVKNLRLREGDTVEVRVPDPRPMDVLPEEIPLDIVYEDRDLLVVNKPRGMVVHPAAGNLSGTLVNALLFHCGGELSGINGVARPGIVHRIDKDTSGLLMVAKNDAAHLSLSQQIRDHSFTRIYETVVHGRLRERSGRIEAPIGRHPTDRKRMAVTGKNSRNAVTHYEVLTEYARFSHLRVRLETGRTHQIRVHMAYLGHPVAGDPVYGPQKGGAELGGQCLHARVVGFIHPSSGEYMEFSSSLPSYFADFLEKLRRMSGETDV